MSGSGATPESGVGARTFEQRVQSQDALFVAVEEQLQNHGVVTKSGLQNGIYPSHPVGYESAEQWWEAFLRPELEARDEFERIDDSDGWKLANG